MRRLADVTAERLAFVEATLASPPRESWIRRPELRGERIAFFHLPNRLCKLRNALRREPWQARKRRRDDVLKLMRLQWRSQLPVPFALPLEGRPQLIAIRFSSKEPDVVADAPKEAIDCLSPKHGGLGIIRDDAPRFLERWERWEFASERQQFTWIEVRA